MIKFFDSSVYTERRNRLKKAGLKGIAFFPGNQESPMNYPANGYHFRQDSSFLYFFGIDLPGLVAIIDFDEGREIVFGNDVDVEDIIWMGPQPSLKELGSKVGISDTRPYEELGKYLNSAKSRYIHFLPPYRPDNKILIHQMLDIAFGEMKTKASVALIKAVVALRSVKSAEEIAELETAAIAGYKMHMAAFRMAKAGVMELEIAGVMEGIAHQYGSCPSFPIILSRRGETLHNHDHSNILQNGDLLLSDAGAESLMHYASDYTRTMPVGGKFSSRQKDIYNIVLNANNKAFSLAKPGVTYKSVHLESAKVIADGLKSLGLMKGDTDIAVEKGAHALFFPHGLGHMMGLDVHDMEDLGENHVGYDEETHRSDLFGTAYLRMGRRLQPGHVITDEPGIYFIPALIDQWEREKMHTDFINYDKVREYIGFGGIRLEDDLLITADGCKLIGERLPITVEEVESVMNS